MKELTLLTFSSSKERNCWTYENKYKKSTNKKENEIASPLPPYVIVERRFHAPRAPVILVFKENRT